MTRDDLLALGLPPEVATAYSDLPAWMWDVPVDGRPRLYLSRPDTYGNHRVLLWRWCFFLHVCHPKAVVAQNGDLWTWISAGVTP